MRKPTKNQGFCIWLGKPRRRLSPLRRLRQRSIASWRRPPPSEPLLPGMVALVLLVRPLVMLADVAIRHNALIPGATSLIRWQSHWKATFGGASVPHPSTSPFPVASERRLADLYLARVTTSHTTARLGSPRAARETAPARSTDLSRLGIEFRELFASSLSC